MYEVMHTYIFYKFSIVFLSFARVTVLVMNKSSSFMYSLQTMKHSHLGTLSMASSVEAQG